MTSDQQSVFREQGYLVLRKALGKSRVEPVRNYVIGELKRLKIWSSGKMLSTSMKGVPAFQQITRLSSLIKQDDLHAKLIDGNMLSTIASLGVTNLASPPQSQFLISLPRQGGWTIDGLNWHVDISATDHRRIPGIQAFILIGDVLPRGGATLAIAGSHLLAGRPEANRKIREMLRSGNNLEAELRSHDLSIVEMSGHAGDVYLMDMRLLHTPSINSTDRVRIMATARYLAF